MPAVALAQQAGFGVSKEDQFKYQCQKTSVLSDEELEGVAGCKSPRIRVLAAKLPPGAKMRGANNYCNYFGVIRLGMACA